MKRAIYNEPGLAMCRVDEFSTAKVLREPARRSTFQQAGRFVSLGKPGASWRFASLAVQLVLEYYEQSLAAH